jgi:hypothetical protein
MDPDERRGRIVSHGDCVRKPLGQARVVRTGHPQNGRTRMAQSLVRSDDSVDELAPDVSGYQKQVCFARTEHESKRRFEPEVLKGISSTLTGDRVHRDLSPAGKSSCD